MLSPGFWGSPTSTIDWCEANYVHSPYVCEWFNTMSSLAMVLAGVIGFWLHRRVLERRFLLCHLPSKREPGRKVAHVLVSLGLYLLTLVIAHNRLEVLGRRPELCRGFGFIPYLIAGAQPHQ